MKKDGLLSEWRPEGVSHLHPLSAGWWLADPLGAMGAVWASRLAEDRTVIHLDDARAEAVLGIPGPEAELARLLAEGDLAGSAHRVVALHAHLLAAHSSLLYFTRHPLRLSEQVRAWLVAAARAGGSKVLVIVKDERELPSDWAAGRQPALTRIPAPRLDAWELAARFPTGLTAAVPLFSLAAFAAACGNRLDVADLALAEFDGDEERRRALLEGAAGRLRPGGALDRSLASLIESLPARERALGERLASSVGAMELEGDDVGAVVSLQELGLAAPVARAGKPAARPASELMRSAFARRREVPDTSGGASFLRWLGRLDRANEAMDAAAGDEPLRRLLALRGTWGDAADLTEGLILEHAFLSSGSIGVLRALRTIQGRGPLVRAHLVRVSLESGELHQSVASLCHQELGRRPCHRDDDLVLDLLPPSAMREDYRRGLKAGESGQLRIQAVYFARVLRAAHAPLGAPDRLGAVAEAYGRRLLRVSAGQGFFWALGQGGYRRELEAAADALLRVGRPWHGALAGVHEMSLVAESMQRGHRLRIHERLRAVAEHATAWHHGTVRRAAELLALGTWDGGGEVPEDVQGASLRGRRGFHELQSRALQGDVTAWEPLSRYAPDDPFTAATVRWAQAIVGRADLLETAGWLADRGHDLHTVWLAEAALTMDPGGVHPTTPLVVGQAGRAAAQAVLGFPVLEPLVAPSALTEREAVVERARLVGEDTDAIARRLSVSPRTVETHRASATAKAQRLASHGFAMPDARRWCLELSELPLESKHP